MDDQITISLSSDHALVLFEWLSSRDERDFSSAHPAEQRVLWDLESQLETKLPMLFDPDYAERVDRARHAIGR
ncbi:hypothetical protein [Microbacterium algeriense]|uniref:Addiction module protein n=1 Tax=Microbacterium algeriense TaxID=2615184 RepID=A0ABQ6V4A4_9MICO|nr:hypothetical protein [Microbacterium algeriense]KAB1864032.1 hypothetical protein F6A08_07750 [Microbacterium algeriense]